MVSHYLNRKFQLNKKKHVNVEEINRYMSLSNVAGIIIGGLLAILVDLAVGAVLYAIISFGLSYLIMNWIGKSYQKSPTVRNKTA